MPGGLFQPFPLRAVVGHVWGTVHGPGWAGVEESTKKSGNLLGAALASSAKAPAPSALPWRPRLASQPDLSPTGVGARVGPGACGQGPLGGRHQSWTDWTTPSHAPFISPYLARPPPSSTCEGARWRRRQRPLPRRPMAGGSYPSGSSAPSSSEGRRSRPSRPYRTLP